jgi:hypothetical protein
MIERGFAQQWIKPVSIGEIDQSGNTFRASSTLEVAVTKQSVPKPYASHAKLPGRRHNRAKKAIVSVPSSKPPVN